MEHTENSIKKESKRFVKKIKELIKSLEETGVEHELSTTTGKLRLVNGAHRLAYIYLKKITTVSVSSEVPTYDGVQIIPYDIEWFEKRFSTNDLEIINNEVDELIKYLKYD